MKTCVSRVFTSAHRHIHSTFSQVHPMFRTGFLAVLQKSQAAGAVDLSAFSRLNQSLRHHHRSEDGMWFPGFRRSHPEFKPFIDVLEADHARLVLLEGRVMRGEMQARLRPNIIISSALSAPAQVSHTRRLSSCFAPSCSTISTAKRC